MELKAMFFTGDALIAAFLVVGALIAASSFYVHESEREDVSFFAKDIVNILNNIKVGEINNSFVRSLIQDGNITNLNNSLLETIGVFWAEDRFLLANDFVQNTIGPLIPQSLSIAIYAGSDPLYVLNRSSTRSVASFKKFVSGIDHDKPVEGYTASIYLQGVDSRHTSSFAYFGGFVGQGNITKLLWLAGNLSSINEIFLELDVSDDFKLYVNGDFVGSFSKGSGGGSYMVPDRWLISSAHFAKFHSGYNSVNLRFSGLGYIAGGFMRVTYNTDTIAESEITYGNNSAKYRYRFPGINGVINLYDSISIPGTLNNMRVFLKWKSSFPTYLTIGDTVVFQANASSANQTVTLVNMSDYPYSLDFGEMSNSTVPIRLASFNLSSTNATGANGDVILITDMSGSMSWRIGSWDSVNGVVRFCNNTQLYSNSTSRRISVAKCLDINFTDIIMAQSGNREWLVDFHDTAAYFSANPLDLTKQNLINRIRSYSDSPSGGTCLCCSLNLAYNILNSFTTSNRSKFVVVLSDGIPTYCCGVAGTWWNRRCANGTSTTQQYSSFACSGGQEDCNNNDCNGPRNNAIWSAQRLKNQFGAKVYTVGMGPIVSCRQANITLQRIAQVGNGTFNVSQNATRLRSVFRAIATSITAEVNQTNQKLIVKGNLTPSAVFTDSYIELNYTPLYPPPASGKILVSAETDRFYNSVSRKNFYLPSTTRLVSLESTSYSGEMWTDNVSISNGTDFHQVFALSNTFVDYSRLGDPFVVMVPVNLFSYGRNNSIVVKVGAGPGNSSNGSAYNRLIYTVSIDNSVGYSGVYAVKDGCIWSLSFADGTNGTVKVPGDYSGAKACRYSPANFSLDDAYNNAAYALFSHLDFDRNGLLDVKIGADNVRLDYRFIDDVPSMWGPGIIEVRIWK
jgi:hypothetical protein